jgi:uncharacterized protein
MTARRRGPALLDVNVLIALAWPNHVHHDRARKWFDRHADEGWATSPLTEAGFVRVSSNRVAIATATTPELALRLLGKLTALAGHRFWIDDVQMVTGNATSSTRVRTHRDVTDAHLLALAERHGGRLLTFDTKMTRLLGGRDVALLDVPE